MQGTPWEPVPGREGTDARAQAEIPSDSREIPKMAQGEDNKKGIKDSGVTRKGVIKHDPTPGCPGCRALMENRTDSMGRGVYRAHTSNASKGSRHQAS